jgi:hypothetical protein
MPPVLLRPQNYTDELRLSPLSLSDPFFTVDDLSSELLMSSPPLLGTSPLLDTSDELLPSEAPNLTPCEADLLLDPISPGPSLSASESPAPKGIGDPLLLASGRKAHVG